MQDASVAMGENAPVSCCLCSNRNLLISRVPTKAKSHEPAYSQALNQNKIDRRRSRSRQSGRQAGRQSGGYGGWCLELRREGGMGKTMNLDRIC